MTEHPLLISVPHAGTVIPREVADICILEEADILADSDGHAQDIYFPLRKHVGSFVTTKIARAFVDQNRSVNDRSRDGVVKTHTCWDVPIYRRPLTDEEIDILLDRYYSPYHSGLLNLARINKPILGVDCHTMAVEGPPVGPDEGMKRPHVCLSNADSACPDGWLNLLRDSFINRFGESVNLNNPFRGGYITRTRPGGIPWVQLEINRDPFMRDSEKSNAVLAALSDASSRLMDISA